MAIEWRDAYKLGFAKIDAQHQAFFMALSQLSELVATQTTQEQFDAVLQKLKTYVDEHFKTEEQYFKDFDYDLADAHIEAHNNFRAGVEQHLKKIDLKDNATLIDLLTYLEDWLVDHLFSFDREYVDCFREHGLK